MINIEPAYLEMVREILATMVPCATVRVFGSRVSGTSKRRSDLDLSIDLGREMTFNELADLREAFEQSDIPIRVDVGDWHQTSAVFQQIIGSECEVLDLGRRDRLPA